MATIFEIDNAIMACVDEETGEVIDFDQLDALQMERETKIENICLFIKSLEAEAEAIGKERDALLKRKTVKENKASRLREYLGYVLQGSPFETSRVAVGFRKSTGLKVTDERALMEWLQAHHDDCISYKAPTVLKSGVAALIKMGEDVPGAMIEERNNLRLS